MQSKLVSQLMEIAESRFDLNFTTSKRNKDHNRKENYEINHPKYKIKKTFQITSIFANVETL